MLPAQSSFERIALNRATFGARDTDVAYAQQIGWGNWVMEQVNAPPGDDPSLASYLASQTMRITYGARDDATAKWPAVDEMRPLNYLTAPVEQLWDLVSKVGGTVAPQEEARIMQELMAATWIRAVHARYQLREVLVDFWHNHFNVGRNDDQYATAALPDYDRNVIRPHVFGNFAKMVEANAKSTAMQVYLDNFISAASTPNENYARELLELHTMGRPSYLGVAGSAAKLAEYAAQGVGVNSPGFTDEDILQASRALSGWTLEAGQRVPGGGRVPFTGKFIYRPEQHNTQAGQFMGVNLAPYSGMAQGQKVIEIAARHVATATFVCTKLVRRLFGDPVPAAVVDRAVAAWIKNQESEDQLRFVVLAILMDGPEIGALPPQKLRRPFERLTALLRTTNTTVRADVLWNFLLFGMGDGAYVWPTPDGRPDDDAFWLSTSASLTTWNISLGLLANRAVTATLSDQTPTQIASATEGVEYWLSRMIGTQIAPSAMTALVNDQASAVGAFSPMLIAASAGNTRETALRRLAGLIATTREFSYR
ncbi:MAG: DUF1800 domain-containing protein [Rhodospirillaceae bacterium]|nr:DUF1800 domain-containing protein [Rhodospirillaceae bacterium]